MIDQTELADPEILQAEQALAAADSPELTPNSAFALSGDPLYETLEQWIDGWFCVTFARYLTKTSIHWCSKWYDHEEAVFRLDALWFGFEHQRHIPGIGLADWIVHHLDPQLRVLLGSEGPFVGCNETRHTLPAKLPSSKAPEGWWELSANERLAIRIKEGLLK